MYREFWETNKGIFEKTGSRPQTQLYRYFSCNDAVQATTSSRASLNRNIDAGSLLGWPPSVAILISICLLPWLLISEFGYSAGSKTLKFPPKSQSLETIDTDIRGVFLNAGHLYQIPNKASHIIKTKFNPKGKTRTDRFGALSDSLRIKIDPKISKGPWTAMSLSKSRYLLLDGRNMSVVALDENLHADISRDVIFDRITPAADSRGEAPLYEIKQGRRMFSKYLRLAPSIRILGMAPLPKKWFKSKKPRYLAFTSIKGFPLVRMVCEINDPGNCTIERFCNLEGGEDLSPAAMAGMAFRSRTKELFVGDRERKIVRIFRYNSCYHSFSVGKIYLPPKIKSLSDIFIDDEERLWISSLIRDDYHNASVYYWEPGEW